jgi:hypothetical protein
MEQGFEEKEIRFLIHQMKRKIGKVSLLKGSSGLTLTT